MNRPRSAFLLAALPAAGFLLAGCSSMSVNRDYDDGFSFSGLTTYAWLEAPASERAIAPEAAGRVRSAVDAELTARGFREVPIERAELVVAARGGTSDRQVYDTYGYGTGRWWGYGNTTTVQRTETEGELSVDIFDASRKELVWRATATDALSPDATPEERAQKVRQAAAKMFEGFPPGR